MFSRVAGVSRGVVEGRRGLEKLELACCHPDDHRVRPVVVSFAIDGTTPLGKTTHPFQCDNVPHFCATHTNSYRGILRSKGSQQLNMIYARANNPTGDPSSNLPQNATF